MKKNLLIVLVALISNFSFAQVTAFWQDKVSVTESSNGSIVCTSDNSYAGSAYSIKSISGTKDGYFEFTLNNCYGMVGLSSSPVGGGYSNLDFAFQIWGGNNLYVIENGVNQLVGSWAKGNVLKIQKTGNVIKYYKDNSLLHTSANSTSTTSTYYADFAFGGANTGFDTPVLVENAQSTAFWQAKANVTESTDGSIVCTSDNSYAGNAYSIKTISGSKDGYFEFTVNNCYGMIGLTSDPVGGTHLTIDFAFQIWSGNNLYIIENGVNQLVGTWAKGNVLKIQKTGNVIKYYKDNSLLHTSANSTSTTSTYYANFKFGGANTGFDTPRLVETTVTNLDAVDQIQEKALFYPNPTKTMNVVSDFVGEIKIYSSNGVLVKSFNKQFGEATFNLDIAPGIYQVHFTGNDKIKIGTVVVQ